MTAVANHPSASHRPEITNVPIILRFAAIRIRSAITGTATIPLMTAAQTKAFMGLTDAIFAHAPNTVASAMVT